MDPFTWGLFAWQSGTVFALRSAELMLRAPHEAPHALTGMALEKGRAFSRGWMDAGMAAMRGADPAAVMAAAARPSRRRVAANLRALRRG